MTEYMSLGHMAEANSEGKYYLPHQAAIRDASLTTKLRVVFDASAKTTKNKCLNDIMYVVSEDIEKRYRQINIAEIDQEFLHVLWRDSPKNKIKDYKLNTVTYGTASAPYLAI